MALHRSFVDWAREFSGDPATHDARGELSLGFLKDLGLTQHDRVLEVGCGGLSLGRPLIMFLSPGKYVGLDPAGWAVEAGFQAYPALENQAPNFLYRSDFSAAELGVSFDVIVALDLVSHLAHAQLSQLLAATREVSREGTKFLLNWQRDQMNSWSEVYRPDARTTFRLETLTSTAYRHAWHTDPRYDLQEKMTAALPSETLNWALLTAIQPFDEAERELSERSQAHAAATQAANELRLEDEEIQDAEQQARHAQELERIAALEAAEE